MYLTIHPSQFNIHYMMLSEKTKNNVMEGGDFFRLYYSDNLCNYNGLFIYFSLKNLSIEKYFNNIKCNFYNKDNKNSKDNKDNEDNEQENNFRYNLGRKKGEMRQTTLEDDESMNVELNN